MLLGQDALSLPEVKGTTDWWMVNYYPRTFVDAPRAKGHGDYPAGTARRVFAHVPVGDRKAHALSVDGIHPATLVHVLERQGDKPVLITENGIATDFDELRVESLLGHLDAVLQARQRGIDVRGYLHWSTLDNFEWGSFVPRFGLVHLDSKTLQRTPKPSAWQYRDIIRSRQLAVSSPAKMEILKRRTE